MEEVCFSQLPNNTS